MNENVGHIIITIIYDRDHVAQSNVETWLDTGWKNESTFPSKNINCPLLHSIWTGSGVHPASLMGTKVLPLLARLSGQSMMLTTHLYLVSGLRMCRATLQLFLVFTAVFIKHKASFTLFFMQCCKCHSLFILNLGCQTDTKTYCTP
jgi:hypothetical protein